MLGLLIHFSWQIFLNLGQCYSKGSNDMKVESQYLTKGLFT